MIYWQKSDWYIAGETEDFIIFMNRVTSECITWELDK